VLERLWVWASGPFGAPPRTPRGLRACDPLQSQNLSQRTKLSAEHVGKLEAIGMPMPLSKSQIRKETRLRIFAPPLGSSFN